MTAKEAKTRLEEGNKKYLQAEVSGGDVSKGLRLKTATEGQFPYAVVVTCSDSRVIPESIFSAGIGEIFVIRVAGNVMDPHQIGSVEYAVEHLGAKLVVVLGHTGCGAVDAAINSKPEGYIKYLTDEILKGIGTEKDAYKACCLNVKHSCSVIEEKLKIQQYNNEQGDVPQMIGAVYHLDNGEVEFLD